MVNRRRIPIRPARATPADYLVRPELFGVRAGAARHLPALGDETAADMAWAQHLVAIRVRAQKEPSTARVISERFAFSISTWSNALMGRTWMTTRLWAAAITFIFGS